MTIQLTQSAKDALTRSEIKPQVVLLIDGVETLLTASTIKRYVRIGDPGLLIDGSWLIGGLRPIDNQVDAISFKAGTSSNIRQSISPDSGAGSTISGIQVALIDTSERITQMISPGVVIEDLMGRKARLYFSFEGTSFPEDALPIFRGVITAIDADATVITLTIDHPDTLKRQQCFKQVTSRLTSSGLIGSVGGISLVSAGSGYVAGNILTLAGGNGNATVKVAAVEGGVAQFQLESGGSGYSQATGVSTSGGAGSGAVFNIFIGGMDAEWGEGGQTITDIPIESASQFLAPMVGPDGEIDPTFECYCKIGDEIIRYIGKTETALTGVTRAALDSPVSTHKVGEEVMSFYRINGSAMHIALKMMLSGFGGPFVTDIPYRRTNFAEDLSDRRPNTVYFQGVDVMDEYGVVAGDYMSLSDSDANDFTSKRISEIRKIAGGSLLTIEDVSLADDEDGTGLISFRSQFDTWPDGFRMHSSFVDIEEHMWVHRLFLSGFRYDFFCKQTVEGKEFLDKEVYKPCAAFAVPRKARCSVAYTSEPIPGDTVKTLNSSNIVNPSAIKLRRSISKNFVNNVQYRFDERILDDGFATSIYWLSSDSLQRIQVGYRALQIDSTGMRSGGGYNGVELANQASARRLERFRFGAEHFDAIKVVLETGFDIEVGDSVILDTQDLKIADTKTGTRNRFTRLYEVVNKAQGLTDGSIVLTLLDTNADFSVRYGRISPSSRIKQGLSNSEFIIDAALPSDFGASEYLKWEGLHNPTVRIRSYDYSTSGISSIESMKGNIVRLSTPLLFTPSAGMWMDFADYDDCTEEQKLTYAFMSDEDFEDGKVRNVML